MNTTPEPEEHDMECPECGSEPAATTQNTATGVTSYECGNGHTWSDGPQDPDGTQRPPSGT